MSDGFGTRHWPVEIRHKKEQKALEVEFNDGKTFLLPAEYLRTQSPSAEVQGHSPEQRQVVGGRRHVGIINITPVGNYAVQIAFDDLHDTGIYSWDYLYHLGENHDAIWAGYLRELEEKGLTRDPPRR
ncbi:MAG: DUF971 domain-containing protein [Rhodospirillales bacterium]|nr:DUF971 domain-containing protein [Rhodospirillales bacterium]